MKSLKIFIIGASLFFSNVAIAQDFQFNNLTQSDVDNIMNDLSGANVHTSVAGASSMAATIGVEVGVVGGMADSPNIDKLVKDSGESDGAKSLPHGGVLARVGLTSLFNFEALFLPKTDFDGSNFQKSSFAAQYNFLSLPLFAFALKGHLSDTEINYSQMVNGADVDVALKNRVMGIQLLASATLGVIEPYAGIGHVTSTGEMNVTGSQTIFDTSHTSSSSMESELSSTHLVGGVEFDFLFFNFGVEASQSFGNSRYAVKASFEF